MLFVRGQNVHQQLHCISDRKAMDNACVIYVVKPYCMENSVEYKDKVAFHEYMYIYLCFFEITFIRYV